LAKPSIECAKPGKCPALPPAWQQKQDGYRLAVHVRNNPNNCAEGVRESVLQAGAKKRPWLPPQQPSASQPHNSQLEIRSSELPAPNAFDN